MKIETFDEKLKVEDREYRRNYFCKPLNKFMESDQKTMVITCENNKEAYRCTNAIKQYKNSHDLNVVVYKRNYTVYVIKG